VDVASVVAVVEPIAVEFSTDVLAGLALLVLVVETLSVAVSVLLVAV
jgi:hypothetical protein